MRRAIDLRTSTGERFFVLQLVRLLGAAAIVVVPNMTGDARPELVALALAYSVVIGGIEVVRRRMPERTGTLVSSAVIIDGLVVVLGLMLSGGFRSPLMFLVTLDVIAVTLLVSYRTGLKLAVWFGLLLLLMQSAVDADLLTLDAHVSDSYALVRAAEFLLFAFATAVFSSVNERSLRRSRHHLETMVDLGTELERAQRVDDVMDAFVRHACAQLGFTRAAVTIRRDEMWHGIVDDGSVVIRVQSERLAAPLAEEACARGAPILVRDLDDDLLDALLPLARNVIVAPVVAEDEVIGVAVGEWGGAEDATMPSLTVKAFAQSALQTALALRNATLLSEVERLATRDGLTGLANRRLFEESLERESARSRRLGSPLTLLIVDVDHFKQINDTYGHPAGDAVLRDIAHALTTTTKAFDLAARYGGDEFVVLLPGCDADDALGVADRVRAEIAAHVHDVPVTVSAGVATMPDNAGDAERLLSAADSALYEAKRDGRDRAHASGRAVQAREAAPTRWRLTRLRRGA